MAICKECEGTLWDYITGLNDFLITGKRIDDGALWQCKACKRVIKYNDWGSGRREPGGPGLSSGIWAMSEAVVAGSPLGFCQKVCTA